jgi:hypothetical protein
MDDAAISLKSVLAKKRRVTLEMGGRPSITALPIAVTDLSVDLYVRTKGITLTVALDRIQAVWDPKGGVIWRSR